MLFHFRAIFNEIWIRYSLLHIVCTVSIWKAKWIYRNGQLTNSAPYQWLLRLGQVQQASHNAGALQLLQYYFFEVSVCPTFLSVAFDYVTPQHKTYWTLKQGSQHFGEGRGKLKGFSEILRCRQQIIKIWGNTYVRQHKIKKCWLSFIAHNEGTTKGLVCVYTKHRTTKRAAKTPNRLDLRAACRCPNRICIQEIQKFSEAWIKIANLYIDRHQMYTALMQHNSTLSILLINFHQSHDVTKRCWSCD